MAGVNIVHVPYKGAGPALNALIGGQTQLMFASASSAAPHVKSGTLRALAVTSLEPSALVPGLPSVAASGVPGYDSVGIYGVFAPAKSPSAIINRLNQEIVRFLKTAEARERFFKSGVEAVSSSPQEFAATIKSEMARMGKVIKDAGIRLE
jgi:tripartite-type tricarboxylate transporter receptor subunit TctC